MAIYNLDYFNGTALQTVAVDMVRMVDSDEVISRIVTLGDSATRYDVDGTAAADIKPGQVRARFKITPTNLGPKYVNLALAGLKSIEGRHGQLRGTQTTKNSTGTLKEWVHCTARCVLVQQEEYEARNNPPLLGKIRGQAFVNVLFEKKGFWRAGTTEYV